MYGMPPNSFPISTDNSVKLLLLAGLLTVSFCCRLLACPALAPGGTYPAKDCCSNCGLCDTRYIAHVKNACDFLGDGMSRIEILPEEVETELKEAAVISMGTEVSDLDLENIKDLCNQVLSLSEYRAQLYDYLKSRMNTIAPNLTALVGELVGARLIAHGGSLLNLAKQPGSDITVKLLLNG